MTMRSASGIILPSIDVFNEDGTISERAGMFVGVDRFKAKELAEKLSFRRGKPCQS